MSSYLSLADAQTLIGRALAVYTNDGTPDGTVDTAHLQLVIDEAEGMVNMAICSRYTIPPTDTNAVNFLRSLVVPILRYKTYLQFAESEKMPDGLTNEYNSVMSILDKLARQVISLPDTSDKTTGRASYIKITSTDAPATGF